MWRNGGLSMDKAQLCTVGISWKRQVAVLLPKTSGVCSFCVFPLWVFHPSPLAGAQADICVSVVLTFDGGGELLGKKRRLLGGGDSKREEPRLGSCRGPCGLPERPALMSPITSFPKDSCPAQLVLRMLCTCWLPAPEDPCPVAPSSESCLGLRREALFP